MTTQQFVCPPERDAYGFPNHGYFIVTISNLRRDGTDTITTEQVQRWEHGRLVEVLSTETTCNGVILDAVLPTCH